MSDTQPLKAQDPQLHPYQGEVETEEEGILQVEAEETHPVEEEEVTEEGEIPEEEDLDRVHHKEEMYS